MESINGISFEDWAAACAHLANGTSQEEVLETLGIELPVWQQTNELWMGKLGDLMAEDMNIATTYGEIFANPKVGKFANAKMDNQQQERTLQQLLDFVPDLDSYKKIFWQQSIASDYGIDSVTVIQDNGLNLQEWGQINMYFINWFNDYLNSTLLNSNPDEYKARFELSTEIDNKWENYWMDFYKDQAVDLADDIEF